jgi:hypothetical protein
VEYGEDGVRGVVREGVQQRGVRVAEFDRDGDGAQCLRDPAARAEGDLALVREASGQDDHVPEFQNDAP